MTSLCVLHEPEDRAEPPRDGKRPVEDVAEQDVVRVVLLQEPPCPTPRKINSLYKQCAHGLTLHLDTPSHVLPALVREIRAVLHFSLRICKVLDVHSDLALKQVRRDVYGFACVCRDGFEVGCGRAGEDAETRHVAASVAFVWDLDGCLEEE